MTLPYSKWEPKEGKFKKGRGEEWEEGVEMGRVNR